MFEELKKYFDTTPPDKILEDWAKSKEFDKIGPTIKEFIQSINNNNNNNMTITKHKLISTDAGNEDEINVWLESGWLVKRMISERVSVSVSNSFSSSVQIVKGKIVYLLEKTTY